MDDGIYLWDDGDADGWMRGTISSWWLSHPIEKICSSTWIISQGRWWKLKEYLKPPPSYGCDGVCFYDAILLWDDDGDADGWMINYELLVVIYLWEFSVMMASFQF